MQGMQVDGHLQGAGGQPTLPGVTAAELQACLDEHVQHAEHLASQVWLTAKQCAVPEIKSE